MIDNSTRALKEDTKYMPDEFVANYIITLANMIDQESKGRTFYFSGYNMHSRKHYYMTGDPRYNEA